MPILDENQGCCYWFLKWNPKSDNPDPPVMVSYSGWKRYEEEGYEIGEYDLKIDNQHFSDFWYLMAKDGMAWHKENPGYLVPFKEQFK